MKTIKAKPISYGSTRKLSAVRYIVIHYTGNSNDTAENNGLYFKNVNKVKAGAHFFVDQKGKVVKSVPMTKVAWAVGGSKYPNTSGGGYYGICTNANSISIELCDNKTKDPSDKQIAAVKNLIKYIEKKCPNATHIIRHYDVTGKLCPNRMLDKKVWNNFKKKIEV